MIAASKAVTDGPAERATERGAMDSDGGQKRAGRDGVERPVDPPVRARVRDRCRSAVPLETAPAPSAVGPSGITSSSGAALYGGHDPAEWPRERAAVIYTLLGTCRLRGVGPFAWLKDVLEKLASGWKQAEIAALLPAAQLDIAA